MPIKFYFTLFSFLFVTCLGSNILIQPTNQGPEIGLIFIEGASIPCDRYVPLATEIQSHLSKNKVWISIPDVFLELAFSITTNLAIESAFKDLVNSGFSIGSPVYLIGHSLGGMAVAEWGFSNPDQIAGIIQIGCFLDRKYRDQELNVPLLMVGGELDGLSRITRFAEEHYHRVYQKDFATVAKTNPIVVIEGLNHMQFASGEPSAFVKLRDLKAEISEEVSHELVASVVADFISGNQDSLISEMKRTEDLLLPIIQAFELEGSIHFNRPNQSTCSEGYCEVGSDWVIYAQQILADKELYDEAGITLNVSDDYVILSSLPPFGKLYHPKLTNPADNVVSITSYAECRWDILDEYLDGGFSPSSAKEIGAKMLTRQCSYVMGLNHSKQETPFTVDSATNWCAVINNLALEWAMNNSATKTVQRFENWGQKLFFGQDDVKTSGFTWVYTELEFNDDGSKMEVVAPVMMTDIDAPPVPIFAPDGGNCYHYCKLLSPARALEWMYVDGLRKKYGL